MVIIRDDIVFRFKLHQRKLPEPLEFSTAFNRKGAGSVAVEWVKFCVLTADHSWTSHTSHAIVVPLLCYPVILELSFLNTNSLLINAEACSLFVWGTEWNLLY